MQLSFSDLSALNGLNIVEAHRKAAIIATDIAAKHDSAVSNGADEDAAALVSSVYRTATEANALAAIITARDLLQRLAKGEVSDIDPEQVPA